MGLRDKYKSAKIDSLKQKADDENDQIGAKGFSDRLEITDGKTNKFRLFPPHNGVDFYMMKKECWITIEKEDGETGRRTVLNSKLHGGTSKDIIDEYIKFAKANLSDKEDLDTLTGWTTGLSFNHIWSAYAIKMSKGKREFGLLEFKKTVRDAINKELFMEDEDDPIEVDPFTDPDEGLPILIKYNSKPNKKKGEDYYSLSVGKKQEALTDEELEKFDKATPLEELFQNVYSIKDFDLALQGLEYYDAEHGFDFFEDDRWVEIVEEVREQYDEEEDEEEEEKPKKKKTSKKKKPEPVEEEEEEEEDEIEEDEEDEEDDDLEEEEEDEDEEEEGDEFDEMERLELRKYIKREDLEIAVKKSMSDDDIREAIREALADDSEAEDEEEEEEEEKPKKTSKKAGKGKMSLEDIRARLRKK